ncbi:zinc ABC transporter ATP-binding protein AztA [soil metagenome]
MPLTEPAVRATDVVIRYGDTTAVARSSFTIPQGAVTALIGPNGSGKSTMLGAIAGLIDPGAGRIEVVPVDGRGRRVSLVLQSTKVADALPVTVGEVVTMGRYATTGAYRRLGAADRAAVAAAIDRMGIADLASHHLSELSGGQRQRVFVAQGLAQEHDLLLLDEPMTGLDLVSMKAIDRVIHAEQQAGGTVVITTHDLAEAHAADHVVLMAKRVVASGPPQAVLTREHLLAAYGSGLLHAVGERIFVDDPAHWHAPDLHAHRDRSLPDAAD